MGKLLIPNFKKGGRMLSRNKDTDYLALSARIHAMEGRLLTRDRMDRMIDAREESEALPVLLPPRPALPLSQSHSSPLSCSPHTPPSS